MIETTLLHILRHNRGRTETLLADQQRGIVGLKSYGGKIELGQTPLTNMCDETEKESNGLFVYPEHIHIPVIVDFYNNGFSHNIMTDLPSVRMYCGITEVFSGVPHDSDEMKNPRWYDIDRLPYDRMILGDQLFIPYVLQNQRMRGWMIKESWKDSQGNIHFTRLNGAFFWPEIADFRMTKVALC